MAPERCGLQWARGALPLVSVFVIAVLFRFVLPPVAGPLGWPRPVVGRRAWLFDARRKRGHCASCADRMAACPGTRSG